MKAVAEKIRKYYKYSETISVPSFSSASEAETGVNEVSLSNTALYNIFGRTDYGNHYLFYGSTVSTIIDLGGLSLLQGFSYKSWGQTNVAYETSLLSIEASQDNKNWTTVYTGDATSKMNLSEDYADQNTPYRYLKPTFRHYPAEESQVPAGISYFNTTFKRAIESTQQDYDFYEDVSIYKAVKETVRKYYKYGNTPNVTKVGNPTISNGVASGFSTSNYLTLPEKYDLLIGNKTWEFYGKFTTSNNVTTAQSFFCLGSMGGVYQYGVRFGVSNGYATLSIGQGSNQSLYLNTQSGTIFSNSTYTFKCNFTGTSYNIYLSNGDILPETPTATLESNKSLVASSTYSVSSKLGVGETYSDGYVERPWLGSIDLKKCYIKINNEDVWHGTFAEESTESDYDFYKDVDVYKAIKSYTKGQYYGN